MAHALGHRLALSWLATGLAALAMGGCDAGNGAQSPGDGKGPLSGEVTVFAASSLTDAFREAGKAFEEANRGAHVAFNFASSSTLATQINEGAPADVFASADSAQMKVVADKGGVEEATTFARNSPVIIVPKGSTVVQSLGDLAKPGVKLVLAAKDVPIGNYARQVLANASGAGGIGADFAARAVANLKSDESNVRAVLSKVQLGEADAGIVYKTDVAAAGGEVRQIEIPAQFNVVATYPIAVVKAARSAALAHAFTDFVRSEAGQFILQKYGFERP